MALNPNIALGVRPLELPNQLAQYAQLSQIQNAQQANQLNRMQMAEYERARAEEEGTRNFLRKADLTDPNVRAQLLTGYGKPGREIYGKLSEAEKSQTEEAARRAKLMQDTQAMYRDISGIISNKADAATFLQRVVNDPALKNSPLAKIPLMEQVARIPEDPVGLDDWKKQFALGATKYISENKPSTQAINRSGQTDIVQTPGLGGVPKTVGTYADVPLPPAVLAQKKDIARASASNISLSTEKKYGESLAGKIADRDDAKLGAAEKAPQLAESANRIIDLVKQGDLFTGPIADIKLNVARGLNVLGADNNAKIANTELLIAATGQSTLDAIKSAGLGTGQGFTDKDLNFLRGIAGGKIDFKPETLTELARLQHLAATRSVQAWNTRFKDIPKSSIEGMGLRTAPDVPPLSSITKGAARPAGVGANWTFESDAAGNKAWVSPDRKSFKEVK
jgi:hypothetical protein